VARHYDCQSSPYLVLQGGVQAHLLLTNNSRFSAIFFITLEKWSKMLSMCMLDYCLEWAKWVSNESGLTRLLHAGRQSVVYISLFI